MRFKYHYETLWGSALPVDVGGNGGYPITLGLRLRFSAKGRIMGVRVAVADDDGSEHVGFILSTTREGVPLRSVRFHPTPGGGLETVARWHHAYFKPLEVANGDELVVAVWYASGRFWSTQGGLASHAVSHEHITAPQTGDGDDNGIYNPGWTWDLSLTFGGNMYGVDVLYLTDTEANR